jgi:tetratricopeptide (TPR) repeat protein
MCKRIALALRASALIVALSLAHEASARDRAERHAQLEESALAAYRKRDLRSARAKLRAAIRSAKRHDVRGPALARIYLQSGIVLASDHEHRAAVRAFRHALEEQPRIELAAELENEGARAAYTEAFQRVHGAAPPAHEAPTPQSTASHSTAPTPSETARGLHALESRLAIADPAPVVAPLAHATAVPQHEPAHAHPPWFLEMSVGLGFSALRPGQAPDRHPSESTLDEVVASVSEERDGRVRAADVESELREHGWECDASTRGGEVAADNCVLASDRGISVLDPIFDMAFGYHLLPRFALALSALVQRHAGHGPMAGIVLGLRAEYMLTPPADQGMQLGAVGGVGIGSLRARGRGTSEEAPAATHARDHRIGSVLSLGTKAAYRTNRHLAFALTPLFNVGLPKLLYDIGVTGGVEVAF